MTHHLPCLPRLLSALFLLPLVCAAGTVSVTVLDKEGKPVPDAVVVVVTKTPGKPKEPLPSQTTITQSKMQFLPSVSVVALGAKLSFVNQDPWEHHVRGSAAGLAQFTAGATGGFELRLDGKAEGRPASAGSINVEKPGAMLLGCHLHGSMRGHVYVSDSPWAQKTSIDGFVTFDDVPDGLAQIRVWHGEQLLDLPLQTITVSATASRATVQLQVVPRRRRI
jgi:plastocyanin